MDMAAVRLDMDPAEIRKTNFVGKEDFPYVTPTGGVYDSGDYRLTLKRVLEMAGYENLKRERAEARAAGRLFGLGFATVVDPSVTNIAYLTVAQTPEERARPEYLPKSGSGESCTVSVDAFGNVTALMNTVPEGQGHETVLAQVVAEVLGVTPGRIRVATDMDTLTRPWTVTAGSYSSRFAAIGAGAATVTARRVREKMAHIAAHHFEVAPTDVAFEEDRFFVRSDPSRSISFRRIAGMAHWNQAALPPGMEPGISITHMENFPLAEPPDEADRVSSSSTYGFVADLVAVEVDPDTGFIRIVKYVTVHDSGNLINPKIVEGQIYGGTFHGVAGALYEELVYNEEGQFLSATLADYLCPTAMEAPRLELDHIITPSPVSVLGTKGCGESGAMSAPAAVANAVADALSSVEGVECVTELPLSPEKVWKMIRSAKEKEAFQ
jgi:2-furoyl-CoA dehydrogenase large subunit